jgi:hypothetical protein
MTQDKDEQLESEPASVFATWMVEQRHSNEALRKLIYDTPPYDTPLMDHVSGIVSDPINWTLDPLAKPPRYESGWTEIITKGKGE